MNESNPSRSAKMAYALYFMVKKVGVISSRLYEHLRKYKQNNQKVWLGKHLSCEHRQKTRTTMTSPESTNPRIWVFKEGVVKYILKTKLKEFLADGWQLGRVGYKPRKHHQGKMISTGRCR